MFLATSCCGCISLRNGTITIGCLSLISAILNAIWMGIHISEIPTRTLETETSGLLFMLKMFIVSTMIYVMVGGIFSALMIAGANKRIHSYVFPWLAVGFGGVVGAVCVTIAIAVLSAIELPISLFFILTLFVSASTALQTYFWIVVYSYYKELVAEKYGHQTNPIDVKKSSPQLPPYHNV